MGGRWVKIRAVPDLREGLAVKEVRLNIQRLYRLCDSSIHAFLESAALYDIVFPILCPEFQHFASAEAAVALR